MRKSAQITCLVLVWRPDGEALSRCLQTAAPFFERIVVGDAGDNGPLLEGCREHLEGTRFDVVKVPNVNVGDNRARLIELVETPLFQFIDDDDWFASTLGDLHAWAEALWWMNGRELGAAHGDTISVDAETGEAYELWSERWPTRCDSEQTLQQTLEDAGCGIAGWIFNKELLQSVGGCDRDTWYSEDFSMYIRAHAGEVWRSPIPAFYYWMPKGRKQSLTTSFESQGDETVRREVCRIVQRAVRDIGEDDFGQWEFGASGEEGVVEEQGIQYSSDRFSLEVVRDLKRIQPKRVLDVGVGAAKVGKLVREALGGDVELWGVDPAVDAIPADLYTRVLPLTIEQLIESASVGPAWDLVVFGDILEHLPWSKAMDVLHWCQFHAARTMLIWPTNLLVWGIHAGYPFWEHRANVTLRDLARFDVETYSCLPYEGTTHERYAVIRGPLALEAGLEQKMLDMAGELKDELRAR